MRTALVLLLILAGPAQAATSGETLYRQRCGHCHDHGVGRTPDTAALRQLSAERIKASLDKGSMRGYVAGLSGDQVDAVVHYLAGADRQ